MATSAAQLIQSQSPAQGQSVSVWKQPGYIHLAPASFRKIWQSQPGPRAKAWLSWAHHEHLILTLLAHADVPHVVQVAGLQVHSDRVEVVTVDAGPDFQRNWLDPVALNGQSLLVRQEDALKLAHTCLKALQSIHALGVMHGDFKSDNLCIQPGRLDETSSLCLNLDSLRVIDFAYAVYREQPLKFVLPTDPDRLTYMPDFFRMAIRQAQASGDPSGIQRMACAQVDLYSLCHMLCSVIPTEFLDAGWTLWKTWTIACERASSKPPSSADAFDAPTKRMLVLTESMLHELGAPKAQWALARTSLKTLAMAASATPLNNVKQTSLLTPLIHVQASTLSVPLAQRHAVGPAADTGSSSVEAAKARNLIPAWRNSWLHHRGWLSAVVLGLVFSWVDRRFSQTGLKLTEVGFILGLMAMALAVPMTVSAVWHAISHSSKAWIWVRFSSIVLCGIAAFYLSVLFGVGVPVMHLVALLMLLALLVVTLLI